MTHTPDWAVVINRRGERAEHPQSWTPGSRSR